MAAPTKPAPPQSPRGSYPHVDAITDWRAQQSIRLLWDRVFALDARLGTVDGTVGDLATTVARQEDDLTRVRRQAGEALAIAQGLVPAAPDDAVSTIPNYADVVVTTLTTKFVSPIVPLVDGDKGKAQLTRAAAWEIYQIDPNIRLLKKTSGNQVNLRSTDLVVQNPDGSFADIASTHDNGDGTVTIVALWIPHPPDVNTKDTSRHIVPTAAIAAEPGPMTPV